MSEKRTPYKQLGARLKGMREKHQETLAEVSGAVEIDTKILEEIERGLKRPSEDILMLLISHFSVKDEDAVSLWELAGYIKPDLASDSKVRLEESIQQIVVMSIDNRVAYTDLAKITTNKYGVIINFMMSEGQNGQPNTVSRVGMSKDHANSLIKTIQKALNTDESKRAKLLPPPESEGKTDNKQQ